MPALYALNILLLGFCAGVFAFYALLVGGFLNWLLHRGDQEVIARAFAPFRASSLVRRWWAPILLVAQVLVASLSLIANQTTHAAGPQLFAILGPAAAYGALHYGTGYAKVENRVCGGEPPTPVELAKYLGFSRPLYAVYAGIAAVTVLLLALS